MVVEERIHAFATLASLDADLWRGRHTQFAQHLCHPGLAGRLVPWVRMAQGRPDRADTRAVLEERNGVREVRGRHLVAREGGVRSHEGIRRAV